jgi:hypothetical protein
MVLSFSAKRSSRRLILATLLVMGVGASQPSLANGTTGETDKNVYVLIDQAALVRLARPASDIVVGNPSIADVSVQNSKLLVVTGKSYGETNLIVMDADGKVVIDRKLIVQDPRTGFVTLYKGPARYTLDCSPNCTPPLVIGDESGHFETISKQIKTKQSISQSSAEGTKQGD